jgi:Raf kinase inhibitor-like YbhB/YbcL family protein
VPQTTRLLVAAMLVMAGCSSAAPATPTSPPAPPAKPTQAPVAPSPVAVVSPSAVAAVKPAASPAASPGAAVGPSPSAAAGVPSPSPAIDNSPYQSAVLFTGTPMAGFLLQSTDISAGTTIPTMFTCVAPGGGISPQLSWSGAPPNTQSYALVEQDPDTPTPNTHWLVYNIPARVTELAQGQPAEQPTLSNGAMQGQDHAQGILPTFALIGYEGACPPPGAAPHRYTFQLFALDQMLPLQPGATINALKAAMAGHIVGQTELIAPFSR